MLHKCANPDCSSPFRLTAGKLFVVEMESPQLGLHSASSFRRRRKLPRRIQYRWLCDDCSHYLTLAFERGRGAIVVPLGIAARKGPVAERFEAAPWAGQPLAQAGIAPHRKGD